MPEAVDHDARVERFFRAELPIDAALANAATRCDFIDRNAGKIVGCKQFAGVLQNRLAQIRYSWAAARSLRWPNQFGWTARSHVTMRRTFYELDSSFLWGYVTRHVG